LKYLFVILALCCSGTPNNAADQLIGGSEKEIREIIHKDNDKNISINLSKTSFKKYEPILALIDYTNISKENDTISHLFTDASEELKFHIVDQNGKIYNERKSFMHILFGREPRYIIKPNEHIRISMPINNYGEWTAEHYDSTKYYFGMMGYLPTGNYKVNAERVIDGKTYETNIVEFQVEPLNFDDEVLLKMERTGLFPEILSRYPNNVFAEHVFAELVAKSHNFNVNEPSGFKITNVFATYKSFFDLYPNSYYGYNYNDHFVINLFRKIAYTSTDILADFENFKNSIQGTSAFDFLANNCVKRTIENTAKEEKNVWKEYKEK